MTTRAHAATALRPYVPELLLTWAPPGGDDRHTRVTGSLAFVDISGFTKLTERLARRARAPGRPAPCAGETLLRTIMIGSGGAVAAARDRGARVVSPVSLGVGPLEFHQMDRMVQAGRAAARALLEQAGPDLGAVLAEVATVEAGETSTAVEQPVGR